MGTTLRIFSRNATRGLGGEPPLPKLAHFTAFGIGLRRVRFRCVIRLNYPMKKNPLSRSNTVVWAYGVLFFGLTVVIPLTFFRNHFAGRGMNPFLELCVFFLYGATVFVACIPVMLLVNRQRYAKIERLRKTGVLPERDKTTDADVIRLAASGHRREASLAFWELHRRSTVVFANSAVGIIDYELVDIRINAAMLFAATMFLLGNVFHVIDVSRVLTCGSFFVIAILFLVRYLRRPGLHACRAAIDAGHYPDAVLRVLESWENPKSRRCFFRRARSEWRQL